MLFSNNAGTVLGAPLNIGDTSITLAAGTGSKFPSPTARQFFAISITDALTKTNKEIIYCDGRTGDVVNVLERGAENTTEQNWLAGDVAANLNTKGTLEFLQNRINEHYTDEYFSIPKDGSDCFSAMRTAFLTCKAEKKNLYLTAGTYTITSENNFPFRNEDSPVTSLLDCNDITIFGDGPNTILMTATNAGADVLQVNGVKNLHFKNLTLKATISGSTAGSNGISVTNGFNDVTFDYIWGINLPSLDKTTYIDGGKAFSIQTPVSGSTLEHGKLKATNIFANGCVYGAGYEFSPDEALINPISIEVDIIAENCRQALVISGSAATSTLSTQMTNGVKFTAKAINCMQDVSLGRVHGVDIECQVITTKSEAQRILSYTGSKWFAADTVADVKSLVCAYAKNSIISVYGNKGTCQNKAAIGGAFDASSGLIGTTQFCKIFLDITGTSTGLDIDKIDAGGNTITDSYIYANTSTSLNYPSEFYTPASNNTLILGNKLRQSILNISNNIGFTQSDGENTYHNIFLQSDVISFKQILSSSGETVVNQVLDHLGNVKFGIKNNGTIISEGRASASAIGSLINVLYIYDSTNTIVGYVPIYNSFTP